MRLATWLRASDRAGSAGAAAELGGVAVAVDVEGGTAAVNRLVVVHIVATCAETGMPEVAAAPALSHGLGGEPDDMLRVIDDAIVLARTISLRPCPCDITPSAARGE